MTPPTAEPDRTDCTLAVIGSGTAGMAAAIFAAQKGLDTVLVGQPAQISFSSGCLDLFACIPGKPTQWFEAPFKGIAALTKQNPGHPYARLSRKEIETGFKRFTQFMEKAGISFSCTPDQNQKIITPAGTLKSTFCVPASMAAGPRAMAQKERILIVDIPGLKGFGARQMADTLKQIHPAIDSVSVEFPGRQDQGDLMCERLGWDLDTPQVLDQFIKSLAPHVSSCDTVGLPAILGVHRFEALREKIEQGLDRTVFEIPTLSPSVTGMRTFAAFQDQLRNTPVRHFQERVNAVTTDNKGFSFEVKDGDNLKAIRAKYLILATGRFLGRGLSANASGRIKENLFNLQVAQPHDRSGWFEPNFFNPGGHPVNRAGIETDENFRPLDQTGNIFHPNLYAAGAILAHQDWKREKSGSGISIASAYKAVSRMD